MKLITFGTEKENESKAMVLAGHVLPSRQIGKDAMGEDSIEGDFGGGISQGIGIGIGLLMVGFVASRFSRG